MQDYRWLHEYCLNRFGSAQALEAHAIAANAVLEQRHIQYQLTMYPLV